ncbi:hypothetical protein C4M97_00425 [Mycoplasmopsis pullorum]|uniref:hypothetical protein n=3 Tax=Mycoplasmopsis pullorum TaxID=48003 RepID=UPI00111A14C6|nr:hypothetical protein [Mycoplasmopsis pullorum]TNK86151.1 hypothetical protein C4M85_00995 [Mycoplasmopsis pullorum]TNK87126.1 hypothetical protein C4M82_00790 [Mycoplasmopsis pullorum]TNK89586.1 hypothetical protein C4M97_00425 [Mycoplasmopsis pullorum]TNK93422.1 hypothetical protein C4M83_00145 [Mycoplasmopsis pullorum]
MEQNKVIETIQNHLLQTYNIPFECSPTPTEYSKFNDYWSKSKKISLSNHEKTITPFIQNLEQTIANLNFDELLEWILNIKSGDFYDNLLFCSKVKILFFEYKDNVIAIEIPNNKTNKPLISDLKIINFLRYVTYLRDLSSKNLNNKSCVFLTSNLVLSDIEFLSIDYKIDKQDYRIIMINNSFKQIDINDFQNSRNEKLNKLFNLWIKWAIKTLYSELSEKEVEFIKNLTFIAFHYLNDSYQKDSINPNWVLEQFKNSKWTLSQKVYFLEIVHEILTILIKNNTLK